MVYYPIPQDQLPVYKEKYPKNPVSDILAGEVLSLPIWPEMEQSFIEQVVATVEQALNNEV
jgi:dTDP-4-amino-4,6-dideoxygalactose transaminase